MTFIKGQVAWNKNKNRYWSSPGDFKKGHIPWNKGKKGLQVVWNKGKSVRLNPQGEFKKGHIGWNKGTAKILICLTCGASFNHEDLTAKYCSRKCWIKSKIGKKLPKSVIKKMLRHRKMSTLEVKFQAIIDKYNLPYKFVGNGKFFIERKNPDFINTNSEKIAVEVFYTKHKEQFRNMSINKWIKDRKEVFDRYGWELLFFDETQVNEDFILSSLNGNLTDLVVQGEGVL